MRWWVRPAGGLHSPPPAPPATDGCPLPSSPLLPPPPLQADCPTELATLKQLFGVQHHEWLREPVHDSNCLLAWVGGAAAGRAAGCGHLHCRCLPPPREAPARSLTLPVPPLLPAGAQHPSHRLPRHRQHAEHHGRPEGETCTGLAAALAPPVAAAPPPAASPTPSRALPPAPAPSPPPAGLAHGAPAGARLLVAGPPAHGPHRLSGQLAGGRLPNSGAGAHSPGATRRPARRPGASRFYRRALLLRRGGGRPQGARQRRGAGSGCRGVRRWQWRQSRRRAGGAAGRSSRQRALPNSAVRPQLR